MDIFIKIKDLLISVPGPAWAEILIRVILLGIFLALELLSVPPFVRVIQPEEAWLYKFPMSSSALVTSEALSWLMVCSCIAVIFIAYGINRNLRSGLIALLVPTLAIPLTGVITNVLKITVGRPRPDYFNRCYGDGYMMVKDVKKACTGDVGKIRDGRKSFPSGHSSLSFCALGFISVFLASQLRTFATKGKGASWRLIITLIPLLAATLVAVSRLCDYRHHWQDVAVGAILGFSIMYAVFQQYFPPLNSINCQTPYSFLENQVQYDSLEMVSSSGSESRN
ncbi:phospholipid phosphatase 5 isoform X2 [Folsomia candida]|uniref:Phosphatidate phosphatase PPAPDC1A n=1 Tax=Folsomia candida TaxID=158441 RepID=A0A226CWP8_FOLCA|nr:phospholipid phosphatase 5 isoform X2 [Folsomia candida]OXA37034.1 Phosphatidate phosphatase PPAPDC1A [Folsomia candida]